MAIRMLISSLFLPTLATRKCLIPIYSPELSFLQEDPADRDWCLPPQVLCRNRERPTCEHDSCAWVKKPKPIGTIPTTPPTQKGSVVLGLQPLFSWLVIVCDSPLKCCQSPHFWSAALPKILAGSGICPRAETQNGPHTRSGPISSAAKCAALGILQLPLGFGLFWVGKFWIQTSVALVHNPSTWEAETWDGCKFEANLGNIVSTKSAWATKRGLVSNKITKWIKKIIQKSPSLEVPET